MEQIAQQGDRGAPRGLQPDIVTARVGHRVRITRIRLGMTRKDLSDASGVSQRYLAQLEAGQGNISIALLDRVADALNMPIEWFVAPDMGISADLYTGLRAASTQQRADVLALLDADFGGAPKAQRVCLLGLRGAGKSSLGAAAGKTLSVPFVELNTEIERITGMPTNEVLALYGTDGYRALQAQALDHVIAQYDRMILAIAGGIVADEQAFERLLSRFHTIWIKASAQEHMDRVIAQGDTRPMAGNPVAMTQLQSLLNTRAPAYDRAEASLDTSGRIFKHSARELVALIKQKEFLS